MTDMKHPATQTDAPLVKTIFLEARPEKVWKFLTEADKIGRWYQPARADLAPGARYELACEESGIKIWGEVLDWQPPTRLVTTFEIAPFEGRSTTVTWDLAEVDGGTLLTMTHTGIRQAAPDASRMLISFDAGWDGHLGALRKAVAA